MPTARRSSWRRSARRISVLTSGSLSALSRATPPTCPSGSGCCVTTGGSPCGRPNTRSAPSTTSSGWSPRRAPARAHEPRARARSVPGSPSRRARHRGVSSPCPGAAPLLGQGRDGTMVVAEFLFIAFVVGIMTKTWLGFLGAFLGLYALHRFTRLSALLSFVLSLYWGLLGFHLGASVGGGVAGAVLAVTVFVVALGVHRS